MKRKGKSSIGVLVAIAMSILAVSASHASPGDPVVGYGTAGTATVDMDDSSGTIGRGSALQDDGRLVVVGAAESSDRGLIVRFTPDGELDPTFGNAGRIYSPGFSWTRVSVDQTSENLIVAGRHGDLIAIARFSPDGSPDTTFANQGIFTTPVSWPLQEDQVPTPPRITGVETLDNGDILTTGIPTGCAKNQPLCRFYFAVRVTSLGSIPPDYGDSNGNILFRSTEDPATISPLADGSVATASTEYFDSVDGGFEAVKGVGVYSSLPDEVEFPDEWPTPMFETTLPRGGSMGSGTGVIKLGPDGDLLVAGGSNISLLDMNAEYGYNPGFGQGGHLQFDTSLFRGSDDGDRYSLTDATFDTEGRLIATGRARQNKTWHAFVARLDAAGIPDPTFDNDGLAWLWKKPTDEVSLEIVPGTETQDDRYLVSGTTTSTTGKKLLVNAIDGGEEIVVPVCDGSDATWIGTDADETVEVDNGVIVTYGGDDTIKTGSYGRSKVCSGSGDDRIVAPRSVVEAGSGDDVIIAGEADDNRVARGEESISGGSGRDRITGFGGDDVLDGGPGSDTVSGGDGNDLIRGDSGRDRLRGGKGFDQLFGGPGRDKLIPGPTGKRVQVYESSGDQVPTSIVVDRGVVISAEVKAGLYCSMVNPSSQGEIPGWTFRLRNPKSLRNGAVRHRDSYSDDWSAFEERFFARLKGRTFSGRLKYEIPSPWWAACWTGASQKNPWVRFEARLQPPARQFARQ